MVSSWTGCLHRVRVCIPISPDPRMLQVFAIWAVRLEPAAVLSVSSQSSKQLQRRVVPAATVTPWGEASLGDQGR
jgi:hypothetical protein